MQTNTTTAGPTISDANAVNAAIAAINNRPAQKLTVPIAIHFICILTVLGAGISALSLLIGGLFMGTKLFMYTITVLTGNLLAIIWMWQMKKKGAYLYTGLFVTGQLLLWKGDFFGIHRYPVIDFLTEILSYKSTNPLYIFITFISGIGATIVLYYSRRMR